MPIFEYECAACGERFEHLQRRAGEAPAQCPRCAGKRLKKALSGFSVAVSAGAGKHEPSAACAACPHGSCPHSGH